MKEHKIAPQIYTNIHVLTLCVFSNQLDFVLVPNIFHYYTVKTPEQEESTCPQLPAESQKGIFQKI